jgi:hypothetical protein
MRERSHRFLASSASSTNTEMQLNIVIFGSKQTESSLRSPLRVFPRAPLGVAARLLQPPLITSYRSQDGNQMKEFVAGDNCCDYKRNI